MRWLEHRIPPPLVGVAAGALMWLLARLAPMLDFALPGRAVIASALAVAGVSIAVAGVVEFHRSRTTVNPLKPDAASALVASGIFRYTRNPMYLGMALALLGFGVWLGNLVSLLLLPAFVAYIHRFQIVPEERAMRTLFGPEFAAYEKAVRRWL